MSKTQRQLMREMNEESLHCGQGAVVQVLAKKPDGETNGSK